MSSAYESLLDYEGPESDGVSERGESILNEMSSGASPAENLNLPEQPGTPSFRDNGMDMSISFGGITPMYNNRAGQREARKHVGKAYVNLGMAYQELKLATRSLGLKVPPTPAHRSTPVRALTPIGARPMGSWRLTPGRGDRPMLPGGLAGAETVRDGKVWIDLTKPPPGYETKSPATGATAAATTATTTPAAAMTANSTAAASTTASTSAAAAAAEWGSGREQRRAGNWQGGKDLRTKIRGLKDASQRQGRREENSERQRRKLGGRCARCFGEHTTPECHISPENLRCTYPPCWSKTGHVTAVCHELTKICVLPVCQKALGHRSFCHKTIPVEGGEPYGYSEEAARRLKEDFDKFSHYLTDEEWEDLGDRGLDNTSGGGEGGRGGGPVRKGRGGYGRGGLRRV